MLSAPTSISSQSLINENEIQSTTILVIGENSSDYSGTKKKPKSRLSHMVHTNISYESSCIYNFLRILCLITITLLLTFGISVGGYYVILEGKAMHKYAHSFNIKGQCTAKNTELLDTYNDELRVTFVVNNNTNSTIFPCDIGKEFNKDYDVEYFDLDYNGTDSWFIQQNDEFSCSTNYKCDDIFIDEISDRYETTYTLRETKHRCGDWTYFGAAVVFFVALVILLCFMCYVFELFQNNLIKDNFYKYQWTQVIDNNEDKFDYILTNWMHKYCPNGYENIDDQGICYDIETEIYKFCGEL